MSRRGRCQVCDRIVDLNPARTKSVRHQVVDDVWCAGSRQAPRALRIQMEQVKEVVS